MADIDLKMRRIFLKPLARRPQHTLDATIYLEALNKLKERAIGEDAVRTILGVLSSDRTDERAGTWRDPTKTAKHVALAMALYESRRISKAEYVFFATFPVEALHDGRCINKHYEDDLGHLRRAITKIEEKHGLGPDEGWPRNQGPKEHTSLNRQYDAILDDNFIATLREFGLDDLADLRTRSPEEFDRLRERGRRSVFHRDEYTLALQDVVLQCEKEAHEAAAVGAYSAAITSLAAGFEGLLLLRCLRSPRKASRLSRGLRKRVQPQSPDDSNTWRFETLVEVCAAAGWLSVVNTQMGNYDTASLAHILRRTRNYVHPAKRAKERPWSETDEREYQDVHAIYVILLAALGKVRRNQHGP